MDIVSVSFMLSDRKYSQTIVKQLSNSSQTVVRTKSTVLPPLDFLSLGPECSNRESRVLGFSVHKFSYSKGLKPLDPRFKHSGTTIYKSFSFTAGGVFRQILRNAKRANSPAAEGREFTASLFLANSPTLPLSPHNRLTIV